MTRSIRVLIAFCMVAFLTGSGDNPTLASPGNETNLYRVRKIFLENGTQANGDLSDIGLAQFASLRPDLKKALLSYGFTIVDSLANADGVMYGGNTQSWLVLDGPLLDAPKYGFQFWLSSPKHNFKWQTQFDISSRAKEAELVAKAVDKAANNLFKDWKKSASKAGIAVKNKLP